MLIEKSVTGRIFRYGQLSPDDQTKRCEEGDYEDCVVLQRLEAS